MIYDRELEMAKEIATVYLETGSYKEALARTKEKYKENFNYIIQPNTDIDNGEIYDINTGETVKEL